MNDTTLVFGVTAIPTIVGLVQVAKEVGLPVRFAPLLTIVFGVLTSLAQVYGQHWPWLQASAIGVVMGLSAAGLYSGVKTVAPGLTDGRTVQLREVSVPLTPDPSPSRGEGSK